MIHGVTHEKDGLEAYEKKMVDHLKIKVSKCGVLLKPDHLHPASPDTFYGFFRRIRIGSENRRHHENSHMVLEYCVHIYLPTRC